MRCSWKSIATASVLSLAMATVASAQATRTWVSGVGDDANPCSRTAPCKTFAGAISKTADGGEIDALDPGGFGAVTITKNIVIAGTGTLASVLASGTQGVVINAPATAKVTLRDLAINGAGGGTQGVNLIAGAQLNLENVFIFNFTGSPGRGVLIQLAGGTTGSFHFENTVIENNTGNGVILSSASAPTVKGTISHCWIRGNGASGLFVGGGYSVGVIDTSVSNNGLHGIENSGGNVQVTSCQVDNNATDGIHNTSGTTRVGYSEVIFNGTFQLNAAGGTLASYTPATNTIAGSNNGVSTTPLN